MSRLSERILCRLVRERQRATDHLAVARLRLRRNAWPCYARKHLVVGCESSGTTPIATLLFSDPSLRFLIEGYHQWVWSAGASIYQGVTRVQDYPRLQLFDCIKVPRFAAILDKFIDAFPNTVPLYVVRDPRDVVASTFKTWRIANREELASVPWVRATWLAISTSDPVARMAMRWRKYMDVGARVPGVNFVKYEDFCNDKEGTVMALASVLGLPASRGYIREHCDLQASHSSVRGYQPQGPGGWRESPLTLQDVKTIEGICADHMTRWGYLR